MLGLYKYSVGSDREPSVRVSLYRDELDNQNPVDFKEPAGTSEDSATIHDLYMYNDSIDINYHTIKVFSIDHDTTDGVYEVDRIQCRYLDETTGIWSAWATTLELNPIRTLTYYAAASPSNLRDRIHLQFRCLVPYDQQTQIKSDVTVSVTCSIEENLEGDGRP